MPNYHRIVVKLGTSTLTAGAATLSQPRLVELARQMANLHASGSQVVLVTSGAVAAGKEALDFPELPRFIPAKQMLAAVGQPRLMGLYEQFFRVYGETIAHLTEASRYPYQLAGNYAKFANQVDRLPVDGHMLVALIAQ